MRARIVPAIVSVTVLASAACTGSDDSSPDPGQAALRFSAPVDCLNNAYCGKGLADVYGVDISQDLATSSRIAESIEALKDGDVDVAVAFSDSPYPEDPELVALEDDQGMIGADNVVPVYRRTLKELYGDQLREDLDAFSALVTDDNLRILDRALADDPRPATAAESWLDQVRPDAEDAAPKDGPRLTVGSAGFLESQGLATALERFLDAKGYSTSLTVFPGGRPEVVDALANGDIDIAPEYAASLLEYLNGSRGDASPRTAPTMEKLTTYLDFIGAQPAAPAPGRSTNVFLTTEKVAEERDLTTLSDLRETGLPQVEPVEAPARSGPAELAVLVRAVGHQLTIGATGREVRDLQERLVQLDYDVEVTGTYDQQTLAAIRDFQGSQGLAPNGVVGPTTEAALADPQAAEDPNPVLPGDGTVASPTPSGAAGGKIIYLTFDDGPAVTYTEQILALLARYDAKATFFELGENSAAHPELTRAVVKAGHALANHTWDHQDMTTLSSTALSNEITSSTRTLEKVSGEEITCMRPPYGAVDDAVRAAVAAEAQSLHLWDIDPQDWSRPGADAIVSNVLANAHPGAVNLMHDGGGDRSQSVAALARILPALAKQGYAFAALPGC